VKKLLIFLSFVFAGCNFSNREVQQSLDIIDSINANLQNFDSSTKDCNESYKPIDLLKLYSKGGKPVKLEIIQIYDKHPQINATYYFHPYGKLFSIVYPEFENKTYITCFMSNYILYINKMKKKIENKKWVDTTIIYSRAKFNASVDLDVFLNYYQNMSYDNEYVDYNDGPKLHAYESDVLKEKPDINAKTIAIVSEGSDVQLLRTGVFSEYPRGKKYLWFFVRTAKGIKGWCSNDKINFVEDFDLRD